MHDIWAFLIQTLTASGAALLLLAVKALLRDKLSPGWQAAVWLLLAGVMLVPAGSLGRYVLVNWPAAVETAKTLLTGEYTLTRITAPFPLIPAGLPHTAEEWAFAVYEAGALILLARYFVTYIRIRSILKGKKKDKVPDRQPAEEQAAAEKVEKVAEKYGLRSCRVVSAKGTGSAFLFGLFRPVLVLPEGEKTDEKVILHELLHLKSGDTVWGMLICVLRCIHWCNPLLWYCADLAGNDLEARCDYRVLERLEGEERREYGKALLDMANEKYARMPGTSSMANGGKNISRRIRAIVRFKKYPAGMALVSVCIAAALAFPLILGVKAQVCGVRYQADGSGLQTFEKTVRNAYAMACGRTSWCTTPAGALDTYGKALLTGNEGYRAMCAPAKELAPDGTWKLENSPDVIRGYSIYNLREEEENRLSALVAVPLLDSPETIAEDIIFSRDLSGEEEKIYIAVQQVDVWNEHGRWVAVPRRNPDGSAYTQIYETDDDPSAWGYRELPAIVYSAVRENFQVEARYQQIYYINNILTQDNGMNMMPGNMVSFDTVPKPDTEFEGVYISDTLSCTYLGTEEEKSGISSIGITAARADDPDSSPRLSEVPRGLSGSSDGTYTGHASFEEDPLWGPTVELGGGGTTVPYDPPANEFPSYYAAELYVNDESMGEMTLERRTGEEDERGTADRS